MELWDWEDFLLRMGFMMVIWVILMIGYEWLDDSVDWGEKGILEFPLILLLLPVILIWSCVWYWVDGLFDWTVSIFGRRELQWSAFWIVVIARVFFGLAGWFRCMVISSAPWSELDYKFDWNTPWWLFAIVTGIITIAWHLAEERRLERLCRDWEAEGKEIEEEERCMDKIRRIRRGGKAKSAPKRARKKAKKRIEK